MRILSYLYAWIMSLRNRLYDAKILKTTKIENMEIFCVGNIAVGGTGKTPAVQYLVRELQKEGRKPAVVSRGYGGKRREDPAIVSDGREIFLGPEESGDECYLHALHLSVPVIVGKDRVAAAKLAKSLGVDCIVLDDGLQHRRLQRDHNIVLMEASEPYGRGYCLPYGRLRERFSEGARRAEEFILTKVDLIPEEEAKRLQAEVETRYHKPCSLAKHAPSRLLTLSGEERELAFLEGKRVLLLSGLANPENFEKTVESLRISESKRLDYKDHYAFQGEDVEAAHAVLETEGWDLILTTEKDWVKFPKDLALEGIYVLGIDFQITSNHRKKSGGKSEEIKNCREV